MMNYRFNEGDKVRLIRTVRNDGTYPGKNRGDLLISRGAVGYVTDTGTFLLDQIIYAVHFLEENLLIGCREEELIDAAEDWFPSRFQFRDKVITQIPLAIQGQILVNKGEKGEIMKTIADPNQGFHYHVHFAGETYIVPETALTLAPDPAD